MLSRNAVLRYRNIPSEIGGVEVAGIGISGGNGTCSIEGAARRVIDSSIRSEFEMVTRWFLAPEQTQMPRVRLFCLPYAGGSAAVYRSWAARLAPDVEAYAVQLPGRGWRLREAPVRRLDLLAEQVAEAIAPLAGEVPIALFGHSMGAWLGLEVVRRLEANGHRPVRYFASGRQAPGLGCTQPRMSHLSDSAFVAEVQSRYGGIPAEILGEPELLALLLPALRADIALLEEYEHRPTAPIATPIHALVGDRDRVVSVDELAPWAEEAAGGFEVTTLPGGHFYFQPDASGLLAVIRQSLLAADLAPHCESRAS